MVKNRRHFCTLAARRGPKLEIQSNEFAERQADPRRHLVGMTVVVLFHVLVV
jgi:hypothetical protein